MSSWIGPIGASAGSRNRDLATFSPAAMNVAAGTLLVKLGKGSRAGGTILDTTNGGTTGIRLDQSSTNPPRAFINGVTLTGSTSQSDLSYRNIALTWDANGCALYTGTFKAIQRVTGAAPGTPACGALAALGGRVGNTNQLYRPIKRAGLYANRWLSQSELDRWFSQDVAEPADTLDRILPLGDSLTAGTGSTTPYTDSYPAQLMASTGRGVLNLGVAGNTSTQGRDRYYRLADVANHTLLAWLGRNNFNDPDQVMFDLDDITSHNTSQRFIVGSVINRSDTLSEQLGGADYEAILSLNERIFAAYGPHYHDIRQVLVDAGSAADKAIDVPATALSADGLHQTTAGYAVVAASFAGKLEELGY